MRKRFRVAVAAAGLAAVLAPSAHAASNDIVDFGAVGGSALNVAGCQPKGFWAIPAGTGTGTPIPSGTYLYAVTAVTPGGETKSCTTLPVTIVNAASQDSTLMQWNPTPGATSYRVYRGASLATLQLLTPVPTSPTCAAPASNPRCTFLDNGSFTPSGTGPSFPDPTTQAGAHADVKIVQQLTYDADVSADVNETNPHALKTNLFHFPPGLLSNPLATRSGGTVVTCKVSDPNGQSLLGDPNKFGTDDPNEDTCPRASLVGTVQTVSRTRTGGGTAITTLTEGDIYNGTPLGAEPGRLFIVLRPACSAGSPVAPGGPTCTALLGSGAAQVEKSFLTARASIVQRTDGTYGIDVATFDVKTGTDQPLSPTIDILAPVPGPALARVQKAPIQVRTLTQNLFGLADQGTAETSDDVAFMTLPASCSAKSLISDVTFWTNNTVLTDAASFTPTGCDAIPFAPKVVGSVGGAGETSQGGHPQLDVTISQASGESATKTATVSLPPLFGASLEALQSVCPEANLQAGTCPAGAQVGTASATSELLAQPLTGPVYIVEQPGGLPKLSVLLGGAVSIRLDGQITVDNGRLVNTFDNVPEVPLSSFSLQLKGGQGGLLQNSADLCSGTGSLEATFTGWSGKTATASAPLELVEADCAEAPARRPRTSVRLSQLASGEPVLTALVRRGRGDFASSLTRVRMNLPRGLRINRAAAGQAVTVQASRKLRRRVLTIRKRFLVVKRVPGGTSPRVSIRLPKGTLKASRALTRRGANARLRFRFRVKVGSGRTFRITVRRKARS